MNTRVTEVYVRQFSEIAEGLPEEKLEKIITFARRVREEVEEPTVSLSTEEILALASERAAELRRQPRPAVVHQISRSEAPTFRYGEEERGGHKPASLCLPEQNICAILRIAP